MCIFCSIIEGSIPSKKVYEDDDVLAILDIAQNTYGHTLVMPKKHVTDMLDVDDETLVKVIKVVRKLTVQITDNLKADGVNILSNCKEAAGQSVSHLHYHILPRYVGDDFKFDCAAHEYDLEKVLQDIKG